MDRSIFYLINRLSGRNPLFDNIMIFVSKRIRYLYLLVLIFMWFKSQSTKILAKKAIISSLVAWIFRIIINIFYFRPRPFVANRVGILIPSKVDSTFLSKHTILAFAIASSILLKKRMIGIILMWASAITGFSRVWVGHHYPSDIVRSAFWGGIISLIVDKVFPFRRILIKKLSILLKD